MSPPHVSDINPSKSQFERIKGLGWSEFLGFIELIGTNEHEFNEVWTPAERGTKLQGLCPLNGDTNSSFAFELALALVCREENKHIDRSLRMLGLAHTKTSKLERQDFLDIVATGMSRGITGSSFAAKLGELKKQAKGFTSWFSNIASLFNISKKRAHHHDEYRIAIVISEANSDLVKKFHDKVEEVNNWVNEAFNRFNIGRSPLVKLRIRSRKTNHRKDLSEYIGRSADYPYAPTDFAITRFVVDANSQFGDFSRHDIEALRDSSHTLIIQLKLGQSKLVRSGSAISITEPTSQALVDVAVKWMKFVMLDINMFHSLGVLPAIYSKVQARVEFGKAKAAFLGKPTENDEVWTVAEFTYDDGLIEGIDENYIEKWQRLTQSLLINRDSLLSVALPEPRCDFSNASQDNANLRVLAERLYDKLAEHQKLKGQISPQRIAGAIRRCIRGEMADKVLVLVVETTRPEFTEQRRKWKQNKFYVYDLPKLQGADTLSFRSRFLIFSFSFSHEQA